MISLSRPPLAQRAPEKVSVERVADEDVVVIDDDELEGGWGEEQTRPFRIPAELLEDSGRHEPSSPSEVRSGQAAPLAVSPGKADLLPIRESSQRWIAVAAFGETPRAQQLAPSTPWPARSPPVNAASEPSVPLLYMSQLFKAFQEQLGVAAPWLFKQELVRRECLPSTLPIAQLSSFVSRLAAYFDSPQARERFYASLPQTLRAALQSGVSARPKAR